MASAVMTLEAAAGKAHLWFFIREPINEVGTAIVALSVLNKRVSARSKSSAFGGGSLINVDESSSLKVALASPATVLSRGEPLSILVGTWTTFIFHIARLWTT